MCVSNPKTVISKWLNELLSELMSTRNNHFFLPGKKKWGVLRLLAPFDLGRRKTEEKWRKRAREKMREKMRDWYIFRSQKRLTLIGIFSQFFLCSINCDTFLTWLQSFFVVIKPVNVTQDTKERDWKKWIVFSCYSLISKLGTLKSWKREREKKKLGRKKDWDKKEFLLYFSRKRIFSVQSNIAGLLFQSPFQRHIYP